MFFRRSGGQHNFPNKVQLEKRKSSAVILYKYFKSWFSSAKILSSSWPSRCRQRRALPLLLTSRNAPLTASRRSIRARLLFVAATVRRGEVVTSQVCQLDFASAVAI